MKSYFLKLIESELKEMSANAAGAIEGPVVKDDTNENTMIREEDDSDDKEPDESMSACVVVDREEILAELRLRRAIQSLIPISKRNVLNEQRINKNKLINLIDRLILREASVSDSPPHRSTGINILEDFLKKVLTTIETDFKRITTDPKQQQSFRAHIINAMVNALKPEVLLAQANESQENRSDELLSEVFLDVGDRDESDPLFHWKTGKSAEEIRNKAKERAENPEFLDIDGDGVEDEEEQKRNAFGSGLEHEDRTGRNAALETFGKVEQNLLDSFSILSDENDKNNFQNYLITNLKLYFDKWTDEVQNIVEEPTTSEYEDSNPAESDVEDAFPEESEL
jgi:hypothetical protein